MSDRGRTALADRVSRRLWWEGMTINAVGTAVVFMVVGFLLAVFFDDAQRDQLGERNLPAVAVVATLLAVAGAYVFAPHGRRALGWVHEGREPTEAEHRLGICEPSGSCDR